MGYRYIRREWRYNSSRLYLQLDDAIGGNMPLFAIGGVTSAGERDTKKSAERKRPVTTRGISELEVPHALAAAG
jgi:hypothetical protein